MTNLAEREAAENLVPHNTIALMDEGIFHRSYSLFVTPEKYLDIKGILLYGRAVKLPDLLIYLKSPVPACLDRICRRELPVRMRGLKRSVALKMMIKGETALNVLIKYFLWDEYCHFPIPKPYPRRQARMVSRIAIGSSILILTRSARFRAMHWLQALFLVVFIILCFLHFALVRGLIELFPCTKDECCCFF